MTGLVVALGSLFAFILLFILDSFARFTNPYVGVLTYLVAPAFLLLGLLLVLVGVLIQRRRRVRALPALPALTIDLSRPRDRRILGFFLAGSTVFLLLTAMGSYYTYHFTESVEFCGRLCHTVMKPEYTTYQHSPHARVACTACHIGPGATWFVRSKLSGAYQVYATIAGTYPRPILTPVRNLRPAQETCEQCHWPKEFVGNVDRTFVHYLSDETNTLYALRLLLKVGGANPTRGPVGGIHWHMSVANVIDYIATDERRQQIPWVRLTDPQGVVKEFRAPGFTNNPGQYPMRRMDCIDCHNRPSHTFVPPNDAVDVALRLGRIDPALSFIKSNAASVLVQPYPGDAAALRQIAANLAARYPNQPRIQPAIAAVQEIYTNNFFPVMKASWKVYPNNIGHKDWPGCTRCHDDKHQTADGKQRIRFSDCHACHLILAQGSGPKLNQLNAQGWPFEHPVGDYGDMACSDCHNGGP